MTEPVVIQSRDRTGRTIITWYVDEGAACAGDELAQVSPGSLHIGVEAPADVAEKAIGLYRNELVLDPWADLSWLTTHHQVEPGGPIEPNEVKTL
jgi:hypothetical protein